MTESFEVLDYVNISHKGFAYCENFEMYFSWEGFTWSENFFGQKVRRTLKKDSPGVKTSLTERFELDKIHSREGFTRSENFLG